MNIALREESPYVSHLLLRLSPSEDRVFAAIWDLLYTILSMKMYICNIYAAAKLRGHISMGHWYLLTNSATFIFGLSAVGKALGSANWFGKSFLYKWSTTIFKLLNLCYIIFD